MNWLSILIKQGKGLKGAWLMGALFQSLGDLAFVLLLRNFIENLIQQDNSQNFGWKTWVFYGLSISLFRAVAYFILKSKQEAWRLRFRLYLKEQSLLKRESFNQNLQEGQSGAEIARRLNLWSEKMDLALGFFPVLVQGIFLFVFLILLLLWSSWILTLIMFAVYIPFVLLLGKSLNSLKAKAKIPLKSKEKINELESSFFEYWGSWFSKDLEEKASEYNLKVLNDEIKSDLKYGILKAKVSSFSEALASVLVVLSLGLSGYFISKNPDLSVELVTFCSALLLLYKPMREVAKELPAFQEGQSCFELYRALIAQPISKLPIKTHKKNSVQIQNLSVGYKSKVVIKNLNLTLNIDKPIWVYGLNGIGKSTFLKSLVQRSLRHSGEIYWPDDYSYDDIFYLSQIPILPRLDVEVLTQYEKEIFFTFWLKELSLVNVWASFNSNSESAEVSVFSGGEVQRLCLFLALLLKPKMMILDEPFSGLPQGERIRLIELLRVFALEKQFALLVVSHDELKDFEPLDLAKYLG